MLTVSVVDILLVFRFSRCFAASIEYKLGGGASLEVARYASMDLIGILSFDGEVVRILDFLDRLYISLSFWTPPVRFPI